MKHILYFLLLSLIPYVVDAAVVKSIDVHRTDVAIGIVIVTDEPIRFDNFYLTKPNRIVIDFYNAVPKIPAVIPINLGPIKRVRVGYPTLKPRTTRIVIDVTDIYGYTITERDTIVIVEVSPKIIIGLPTAVKKVAKKVPRISLDLTNADIRSVLRMLAERYSMNIVISENVTGFITVHMKDVTPMEAFESILKAASCTYVKSEDILIVKPIREAKTPEMETRIFKLEYLDATDAKNSLSGLLSPNGKMEVLYRTYGEETKRSNFLLITDIPTNLEKMAALLKKLDKPLPQISIEARFIETILTEEEAMGIDWSLRLRAAGARVALPITFPLQWEEMTLATLSPAEFTALLEILKTEGRSRLLSNPRIATLDNQTATISVGTTVPIRQVTIEPTTGREIVTYVERFIPITLKVTPHVSEGKYITMTITPSVEAIVEWRGPPGEERPVTSKREATTQITVKDGETIAIGGLIKDDILRTTRKIPILGDIPILGRLFRYNSVERRRSELLIFITPHIL